MQTLLWLLLLLVLPDTPAPVPSRPTGMLKIRVLSPAGQSRPRELAVRVRPTLKLKGNEDRIWEVIVSCPLRDGECVCEVPAGQVDLRFQGAAVMPVYKWGVFVVRGETEDLGSLDLRRGAAITGWVRTSEEKVITHSVVVSLVPERVGRGMAGLEPKPMRTLTLEANSRPWGFFRFEDVLPGRYAVTAQESGRPPAGFSPIVISGDRSFELPEPVWISPPVRLEVQVSPARGPNKKPWALKLVSKGPPQHLGLGHLLGTDRWVFEGLPTGSYDLLVFEDSEHPLVWKRQKVQIGPEPRILSLKLEIPFVDVSGLLLGPKGPQAGEFKLYGEGTGFPFRSDEKGRFTGYLPAEGSWKVLLSKLPGYPHPLFLQKPVRLTDKDVRSVKLTIQIPDTRLRVEVVDEMGRSLPKSWLNVLAPIRNQDQTDEFGRYEMRGLNPGPQCLLAAQSDPPRAGEETPIVLQEGEGEGLPPVRLVVPDKVDIRGRIKPRLGFAAGALGRGGPSSTTGQAVGFSDLTDEDGDFRLSLAPAARTFNLIVLAPGSALRLLQAEVSRNQMLEIHVDTPGGTLILDLGDQTPANAGLLDRMSEDQTPEAQKKTPCDPLRKIEPITMMQILRHWADLQGTPQTPGLLVVPNVEPGPYTLCATDKAPVLSRGMPPEGDARCVGGVLEAAGELALKLPAEPAKPPAVFRRLPARRRERSVVRG